ncbi:P-loop NTPase fold protein [Haloarcula sp. Atlit-120R]|uniref:KAP family P-loop NTPase fold protein n=1 Tax=Haloarcula sp. Atlit-120R TaxID=2282135 RepID=UPI000EF1E129|nr:KAP family NTPase [Haloarcula sp. Atlit-120R]RLM33157.1 hypothetical protein DVK01_18370 [Haloarcula sp. Atlit-120R]
MRDSDKLQPDSPIGSVSEDQLGYGDFSKQLAEIVTSRAPSDGYTIGIYGQWGSGKSTILNFVEEEIKERETETTIIEFNPWWFTDQADLIEKFLTQLGADLESESGMTDIRENLARLTGALSTLPLNVLSGVPADQIVQSVHQLLEDGPGSVNEIKQDIESDLKDLDERIIVMIDDIDRLNPKETLQMFQIIKSVADFPNVTYLLAFDRSVVVDALEQEGNIHDGYLYLDKIVQLPLHIPEHKNGALESLFQDSLASIPEEHYIDTERWSVLLHRGLMPLLDTPRDVIRLSNTVSVMSATIGTEVNFVDLVGLEALRVFHNDVYQEIQSSPQRFVGYRSTARYGDQEPDDYEDILPNAIEKKSAVQSILTTLFPNVSDNINDKFSSYSNWDKKRAKRRICHKDRFPVYFRLDIPEGELATHEIGTILSIVTDYDKLKSELSQLLDEPGREQATKASTFFRRIPERMDNISIEGKVNLIRSIFDFGDELISKQPLDSQMNETRHLVFLVENLIKGLAQNKIESLRLAISDGSSPYMSSKFLNQYLRDIEENNSESLSNAPEWVTESQVEDLKPAVVDSITTAAENGRLIEVPHLRIPLELWSKFDDGDQIQEWINDLVESDEGLVEFVHKMSGLTIVNMSRPVFYLDPSWLYEYIDQDTLETRLKSIETGDDEMANQVVERYETAVKMAEKGKDPSDTENWIFGDTFN